MNLNINPDLNLIYLDLSGISCSSGTASQCELLADEGKKTNLMMKMLIMTSQIMILMIVVVMVIDGSDDDHDDHITT